MPIKIANDLPAFKILEEERVPLIRQDDALRQDIRPLQLLLLNLMPDKMTTETQLARVLGATPLQIELTLLRTESHMGTHTSEKHQLGFYKVWDEIKDQNYDGIIVTGAPVEDMPFKKVDYWPELSNILNWACSHTYSQFYICWGAQAAMYHFYGIEKLEHKSKLFGVYPQRRLHRVHPVIRGFDDVFSVPVSRHTGSDYKQIKDTPCLVPLADNEETGICIAADDDHRRIFMFNHLEYDRDTLDKEYRRDLSRGLETEKPANYYIERADKGVPVMNWRAHRNLLFTNWIGMVYQGTPYDLSELEDLGCDGNEE
ncbi:MAG: homoserine O-succinyltransferase [Alphaproteobacteria bacterium]|nr:homoserine O-succinyltransferase [Alphaproteobacteria bacterium]